MSAALPGPCTVAEAANTTLHDSPHHTPNTCPIAACHSLSLLIIAHRSQGLKGGRYRELLEWTYTGRGGEVSPPAPPPPSPVQSDHSGNNEMYHWENLAGPFFSTKFWIPYPPPLSPSNTSLGRYPPPLQWPQQ